MNKYSITTAGILVMVVGTWLVDVIGLTEACSTEITGKAVAYAPLLIGGVIAWFGRFRLGDMTITGFKKK